MWAVNGRWGGVEEVECRDVAHGCKTTPRVQTKTDSTIPHTRMHAHTHARTVHGKALELKHLLPSMTCYPC